MDNITHTLVGLALADSGLKRRSRLGTAALVVGANLPDMDALVYFVGHGGASALAFRRGWTHGVLAMAVLPAALTAGLLGWDRLPPGRPRPPRAAPPRPPPGPGPRPVRPRCSSSPRSVSGRTPSSICSTPTASGS